METGVRIDTPFSAEDYIKSPDWLKLQVGLKAVIADYDVEYEILQLHGRVQKSVEDRVLVPGFIARPGLNPLPSFEVRGRHCMIEVSLLDEFPNVVVRYVKYREFLEALMRKHLATAGKFAWTYHPLT